MRLENGTNNNLYLEHVDFHINATANNLIFKGFVMQVFFDTEFSSLNKKNGHRYLISIGCVAHDGREFYAELSDTCDLAPVIRIP